jgi:N-acetyl-anhydromuramoyl-L-alanine amidase
MRWDRMADRNGQGWLAGINHVVSPNCDQRPADARVDLLVIHYISLPPGHFGGDAIERLFCNQLDGIDHSSYAALRGLRVSAHFLIRRRGQCVQFVSTDARAWHAGQSRFQERERCNDFSIGVELEGDGEHRFTQAQYQRLARLTKLLARRHSLQWVAGHSDIAPQRKQDPGPFFEWPRYLASIESTRLTRPF